MEFNLSGLMRPRGGLPLTMQEQIKSLGLVAASIRLHPNGNVGHDHLKLGILLF